ncbi:hypothetical protein [Pilimelia columellifera]|uniref:Secreted protein n=1 Tax=Pilimelia columellifera subsp. columellifera TaxID=706583 RepID=A0ABN3NGB0_9ACTN
MRLRQAFTALAFAGLAALGVAGPAAADPGLINGGVLNGGLVNGGVANGAGSPAVVATDLIQVVTQDLASGNQAATVQNVTTSVAAVLCGTTVEALTSSLDRTGIADCPLATTGEQLSFITEG